MLGKIWKFASSAMVFLSLMGICEALSSCFIMSLLTTVSDCIDEVMADTEQQ